MPDAELVHQLNNDLTIAVGALSLLATETDMALPAQRLATERSLRSSGPGSACNTTSVGICSPLGSGPR